MYTYIVEHLQQITPSTLLLTIKSGDGIPIAFQPGQYAAINFYHHHRPSVVRCFSIVSSPTQQDILQFSMRTKGRYTKALRRLQPGDKINVRGPFGGFIFDANRDKRTVFLAGGIGITPFISMVRFAAATESKNEINLIYSCQTQDDIPFFDELKELEKINPHFKVTFVIGDGVVDKLGTHRIEKGRINQEIINKIIPTELITGTTFLICGPPPFMNGMRGMLQDRGVQRSYIMTEAFSQGPNRQTGKVKNWPFNMYMLSAVGLAVSAFVIMIADLVKTLPPSSIFGSNNNITKESLTNSRQTDLDSLVNSLPMQSGSASPSEAAANALNLSQTPVSNQQNTSTVKQGTNNTQPSSTNTQPSQTTTTTKPAPTPPQPTCTTSQSGVTTCL